jgi:hypothetical protein
MIALTRTSPRTDVTRPFGVILLLATIALALSACGGGPATPPGTTNTNYGEASRSGNVTAARPEIRTRPENARSRTTAAIPFKRIPEASLKGLSEQALKAKIGEPEMIRGEGDIRVWQYRSDQCSFDAFFAPATEDAPRELRHMLARMRRGNQPITVQDCLDQVVKKNLGTG